MIKSEEGYFRSSVNLNLFKNISEIIKMSPPHPLKQVAQINEESRIIKTSKIGKVKTEIRKKIPSVSVNTMNTTTVKRKYILNRKN